MYIHCRKPQCSYSSQCHLSSNVREVVDDVKPNIRKMKPNIREVIADTKFVVGEVVGDVEPNFREVVTDVKPDVGIIAVGQRCVSRCQRIVGSVKADVGNALVGHHRFDVVYRRTVSVPLSTFESGCLWTVDILTHLLTYCGT